MHTYKLTRTHTCTRTYKHTAIVAYPGGAWAILNNEHPIMDMTA